LWRCYRRAALLSLLRFPAAQAQDSLPTILVRPWKLRDTSLALVYANLLRHSDSTRWVKLVVPAGANLSSLIYQRYGVGDTYRKATGKLVQDAVARFNRLPPDAELKEGQTIFLPQVPVFLEKYGRPADRLGTQVWRSDSVMLESRIKPNVALSRAPVWRLDIPTAEAALELSELILKLRELGDPAVWEAILMLDNTPTRGYLPDPEPVDASDSLDLNAPNPAPLSEHSFKTRKPPLTLFVLDFFGAECGHGQKVLDVVHETLHAMGLDSLGRSPSVIPIDLDLRSDLASKKRVLDRWLEEQDYGKDDRRLFDSNFAALGMRAAVAKDYVVSLIYYTALMDSVLRTPGTRVVTSSFYVDSPYLSAFAADFGIESEDLVFFFSASGNDNKDFQDVSGWRRRQPQKTFFDKHGTYPFYMVGGQLKPGKRYGIWSSTPWAVPFVGQAAKWGGQGTCISPSLKGTSFAAPAVAAALFGALNVWREAHSLPKDRPTTIRRMLTAVRPDARLSPRYAAPGSLDYDKLLLAPGSFVRLPDGRLMSLPAPVTGEIRLTLANGTPRVMTFGTQVADELWALSLDANNAFALGPRELAWLSGTLQEVHLKIPFAIPGCVVAGTAGATTCEINSPEALRALLTEIGIVR
jgi:hypothetical protein